MTVIIGGGVSGLATAFYLKQRGIRCTIIEGSGRLGGLIQTNRVRGCDLEAGPDSFISTKPAVAKLAEELGISDKLIGSNDAGRRVFVVRKGKLTAMPRGMVMMVPSDWKATLQSPLFTLPTKMRFLREYFSRPRTRTGDFSVRDLVLDHFGEEALQYLTEPLLAGVYGGNAAALSARSVLARFVDYETNYGSLIKGVQTTEMGTVPVRTSAKSLFLSFQAGMQTLTESLIAAIRPETDVRFETARKVTRTATGWDIDVGNEQLRTRQLVLACPAHRSAALLSDSNRPLSELLAAIPYSSSILVTFLLERSHVSHPLNGFGFLVPPPERQTIAAATWINTKFPFRVAPNLVAIRVFLVDPEADRHSNTPDSDLAALAFQDLQSLMALGAPPVYTEVYRWPRSMPQYIVGHSAIIAGIRAQLSGLPGLYLASNFIDGVGIPDCVRNAKAVATEIAANK